MITNANVVALFAESIRQEVTGQHTLVGVFEDIAEFQSFPAALPQLAMLVTVSTLANDPFTPKLFRVLLSTGETLMSHDLPDDIESRQEEAISKRTDENSSGWIYLRLVMTLVGVQVSESAKMLIEFEDRNGNSIKSNSLDFRLRRQPTTVVPPAIGMSS